MGWKKFLRFLCRIVAGMIYLESTGFGRNDWIAREISAERFLE